MSKNLIITVVIVVVLVGGAAYFISNKSSKTATENAQPAQQQNTAAPSTQTQAAPSANSVEYISGGFNPSSITIKAGETVTWTNKDTGDVWVASNPHPIHTDYPGFDAKKNIPSGGTYSFTFTKVGTWGYHNHLNPAQGGMVVVTQ